MKNVHALFVILIILVVLTACAANEKFANATMTPGDWDYVVLGDSITLGYPELLKTGIEDDFDGSVTITIKNWYMGGQTSSQMLRALQTTEQLREDIRKAEMITVLIPWAGCAGALKKYGYGGGGSCGGEDNQDCLRECLANYKSDTTAIFAELVDLRNPSEALIRVHDVYQFHTSSTQELGTFDVINSYWQEANTHVHDTAESYGIPVAYVYDAFMGEDGIQPPEENGLVGMDMVHTTSEGQQLIAELLRGLGYELSMP